MPNIWKYIFLSLVVILFGVSVYLVYEYLVESKRSGASSERQSQETLTGEIMKGSGVGFLTSSCPDEYYLVFGQQATWLGGLGGAESDKLHKFSKYVHSEVEVTGVKYENNVCSTNVPVVEPVAASCICDDYLVVDDIKVIAPPVKTGEEKEYEGKVVCLTDKDGAPLESCRYGLETPEGQPYLLNFLASVDESSITSDLVGAKVKVSGIMGALGNNSDIGADGQIDVFEITGVE